MWGPKLEKRRKGQPEKKEKKFEGGSWSDFPARFRGGVVDEVRKFEGGVVGAIFERFSLLSFSFLSFFFCFVFSFFLFGGPFGYMGAPLDTRGP